MESEVVTVINNVDHVLSSGAVSAIVDSINLSNEIGSRILTMLYIFLIILLAYLLSRLYYKIMTMLF